MSTLSFQVVSGFNSSGPVTALTCGDGNGFYTGDLNSGHSCGSSVPDPAQLSGADIVSMGYQNTSSCSAHANGVIVFAVQGTVAQSFFSEIDFVDAFSNSYTLLSASAIFSTSYVAGYSVWSWPSLAKYPFQSSTIDITVTYAGAPDIITQPTDQEVFVGSSAAFSVVASGTAPITYQWYKDATLIPGATGSTYITPPSTFADSGAVFTVDVTDPIGTTTSDGATLTVDNIVVQVSSAFVPAAAYTALLLADPGNIFPRVYEPKKDLTVRVVS